MIDLTSLDAINKKGFGLHIQLDAKDIEQQYTHRITSVNSNDPGWEWESGWTGHKLRHKLVFVAAILSFVAASLSVLAIFSAEWTVVSNAIEDTLDMRQQKIAEDYVQIPWEDTLYLRAFGASSFGPVYSKYPKTTESNASSHNAAGFQLNRPGGICQELAIGDCIESDMSREVGRYAFQVWKCRTVQEICGDGTLILVLLIFGFLMNLSNGINGVRIAFEIVRKPANMRNYKTKKFLDRWNEYRCSQLDFWFFNLRLVAVFTNLTIPCSIRVWEITERYIEESYSSTSYLGHGTWNRGIGYWFVLTGAIATGLSCLMCLYEHVRWKRHGVEVNENTRGSILIPTVYTNQDKYIFTRRGSDGFIPVLVLKWPKNSWYERKLPQIVVLRKRGIIAFAALVMFMFASIVYANLSTKAWAVVLLAVFSTLVFSQVIILATHELVWHHAEYSARKHEKMSMHDHVHAIKLSVVSVPAETKLTFQERFDAPFPKGVFFECEKHRVEMMDAATGMEALHWKWEDVLDFSNKCDYKDGDKDDFEVKIQEAGQNVQTYLFTAPHRKGDLFVRAFHEFQGSFLRTDRTNAVQSSAFVQPPPPPSPPGEVDRTKSSSRSPSNGKRLVHISLDDHPHKDGQSRDRGGNKQSIQNRITNLSDHALSILEKVEFFSYKLPTAFGEWPDELQIRAGKHGMHIEDKKKQELIHWKKHDIKIVVGDPSVTDEDMDIVRFKLKGHQVCELQCDDCTRVVAAIHLHGVQAKLQTPNMLSEHASTGAIAACELEVLHVIHIPKDIVPQEEWPVFARLRFCLAGLQLCSCVDGRLLCLIDWPLIVTHTERIATHKANMDVLEIEIDGETSDDSLFIFESADCHIFPSALQEFADKHAMDSIRDLELFSSQMKVFV